ncbi:branchpoint-bridging protein-like [Asparagus officinalis]|nr:branchpoint-bridging protein-like [Asparagus officinalis]
MNMSSNITSCAGRPSELSCIKNSSGNAIVPEKLPANEITGKKRRRRWDISENEVKEQAETGKFGQSRESEKRKTRRSRWSSEDSQHSWALTPNHPGGNDLETPKLLAQLFELTKKLQSGIVDDRLESERSPSPPPLYNNLGFQINTREARLRSKLMKQRQEIIKDLMKSNPNFKPPPDYKTNKLRKKVYIPVRENPGYNFIGLILGPRGKTQKQMEEETGAKIVLRGKGSSEQKPKNKCDSSDDEDLHVLIEADDRYSLDAAVSIVEKLLIPVEDGHNVHKLKQLRELAELNGTLRNTNTSSSRKFDPCNVCGDKGHPTVACPLTAPSSGANSKGQKVNFFAEMGGGVSPFSSQPPLVQTIPPATNFAPYVSNRRKEIDDANLFVGQLPPSVDNTKMRELFTPFGLLCEAKVIRDKITGLSKGYGFVKYADHVDAAKAVANMNGCKIEGKTLVVRIAGIEPLPSQNSSVSRGLLSQLPTHSGSAAIAPENPDPMHWPGPPESRLPESLPSFSNNSGLPILSSPFNGQYLASLPPPQQTLATTSHFSSLPFSNINSLPTHNSSFNGQFLTSLAPSHQTQTSTSHFSGGFATPEEELLHFPGYLKSFDPPPPMPSTSLGSSQFHFPQNFGSYQMPPS